MKRLLAITIVMTICLGVYAETTDVEHASLNKGALMQKFEEEDAAKMSLQMQEERTRMLRELEGLPQVEREPDATDFYVSWSYGDDANDGICVEAPWKTLARVNKVETVPGDRFFFMRGDEWRGEIIRENLNNVSFSDYGYEYDDKPVINGAVVISGWEDADLTDQFGTPVPNVYVADLPVEYTNRVVKQLFVDGERQTLARFPNESYWDIDDIGTHIHDVLTTNIVEDEFGNMITNIVIEVVTNVTTLIDNDLSASPYNFPPNYWSDSTVFVRYEAYKIISCDIGYSNGITGSDLPLKNHLGKYYLGLSTPNRGGYFIANSIHAIDSHGEWFYDEASRKIYLCRENEDPDNYKIIEASVYPYGFCFQDSQHISIENVMIKHSANNGINFIKDSIGNDYNIVSNKIEKAGEYGVYIGRADLVFSTRVNIKNCNIIDSGATGIKCLYTTFTDISDNYIDSSALDGEKNGVGIHLFFCNWSAVPRTYNIIKRNRVFNSGYDGISFSGYGSLITENFVSNYCTVLNDGGAIYGMQKYVSWSEVSRNILMDGVGNTNHSRWGKPMALGIYIDTDELGKYVNVTSNTVINTTAGFAVKNITSIWLNANMFYHNKNTEMGFSRSNTVNSTSLFNIIVTESDNAVKMGGFFNKEQLFFNSNYYCNIYEDTSEYFVVTTNNIKYRYTLTEWKDNFSQDVHSVDAGVMLRDVCDNVCESRILYNPTLESKTFDLKEMEYYDIETNKVTGSVTLPPFTSKVLFFRADTHYVAPDGAHSSPFYYPEIAASNIQAAVDVAGAGHTVLVARATYYPSDEIVISNDIVVKSISGAEETVIDGDDTHRCVCLNSGSAVLDGFTLTKGAGHQAGGGVYCGAGTVRNCIIEDNWAYDYGGGAYCEGTMGNCLVKHNISCGGGGIYCNGGSVNNCTIIDNDAVEFGGGIYCYNGASVLNSIVYYNSAEEEANHYNQNGSFAYCCTTPSPPGSGNISYMPEFADGNGRLLSTSPCVDAGNNSYAPCAEDLDGFARIRDNIVDMGAYESAISITNVSSAYGYYIPAGWHTYITWTGSEYADVWTNISEYCTAFSPTNSEWGVAATSVTSPWQFTMPDVEKVFIHLTHADEVHPIYEDDTVITIYRIPDPDP